MYVTAIVIQTDDGNQIDSFMLDERPNDLSSLLPDAVSNKILIDLPHLEADDVYVDITPNSTRLVAGWHVEDVPFIWLVFQKEQSNMDTISVRLFTQINDWTKHLDSVKQYIKDSGLTYTDEFEQLHYQIQDDDYWFIDVYTAKDNRLVSV